MSEKYFTEKYEPFFEDDWTADDILSAKKRMLNKIAKVFNVNTPHKMTRAEILKMIADESQESKIQSQL